MKHNCCPGKKKKSEKGKTVTVKTENMENYFLMKTCTTYMFLNKKKFLVKVKLLGCVRDAYI